MCKCTLKMHSCVKRKLMKESFIVTALSFSHCRQIEKKISFMTSMVDISVQLKYKKLRQMFPMIRFYAFWSNLSMRTYRKWQKSGIMSFKKTHHDKNIGIDIFETAIANQYQINVLLQQLLLLFNFQ